MSAYWPTSSKLKYPGSLRLSPVGYPRKFGLKTSHSFEKEEKEGYHNGSVGILNTILTSKAAHLSIRNSNYLYFSSYTV